MGQSANRQLLVLSECGQLSQAIPQFHMERILHQRTPIARFEPQCNKRRAYEDQILSFEGRYELQRTLAIRIAAITLASDSAITIAKPSGPLRLRDSVQSQLRTAVENCGLYRVFVSRLFWRSSGHYSATIARLSAQSGLERGGEDSYLCVDAR